MNIHGQLLDNDKMKKLEELSDKLASLLKEKETGLHSWWKALNDVMIRIRMFWFNEKPAVMKIPSPRMKKK